MNWGATQEEWDDWSKEALADLLPVVSNPSAAISDQSTLKAIGKTPSRYNQQGKVSGFSRWTDHIAVPGDVEAWRSVEDYGICVQTRRVRAIDIDVEDEVEASKIERSWQEWLFSQSGSYAPVRWRANSARRLLAVVVPGTFHKRVVKVEGGIVEFLGNGQQFVAAGTHTSGERYQWRKYQS